MIIEGREILYHNQRDPGWTHPYPYLGGEDLHSSGCGIFSLCHCLQWMTGRIWRPEELADMSVACGGRGDDGTDRPALLTGLEASGMARRMGFVWRHGGLENDLPRLYAFLREEQGVAMANLRKGHIVALLAAREMDGARQILAVDSVSETSDPRVKPHVAALVPGTRTITSGTAADGVTPVCREGYAAFWVTADCPRDYTLLYRIQGS
ncbi:MAG: hypothetical protein ACI4O7_06055 [Aristaeellaceae bacterium]